MKQWPKKQCFYFINSTIGTSDTEWFFAKSATLQWWLQSMCSGKHAWVQRILWNLRYATMDSRDDGRVHDTLGKNHRTRNRNENGHVAGKCIAHNLSIWLTYDYPGCIQIFDSRKLKNIFLRNNDLPSKVKRQVWTKKDFRSIVWESFYSIYFRIKQ